LWSGSLGYSNDTAKKSVTVRRFCCGGWIYRPNFLMCKSYRQKVERCQPRALCIIMCCLSPSRRGLQYYTRPKLQSTFSGSYTARRLYRFVSYRVLSYALYHLLTPTECKKPDPQPPYFRRCMINFASWLFLSFVLVHHTHSCSWNTSRVHLPF
jgi:hypothetical protein